MLIFNNLQKHKFQAIFGLYRNCDNFHEQTLAFICLCIHKNKDIFINLHFFLQIRINCIRWKPRQNIPFFTFQFSA